VSALGGVRGLWLLLISEDQVLVAFVLHHSHACLSRTAAVPGASVMIIHKTDDLIAMN